MSLRQRGYLSEDTNKQKQYAIVVAMIVSGKSRGPEGFKRRESKLSKYELENSHSMVYSKVFNADSIKDAKYEWQIAKDEMKRIFSKINIRSYTVVLHDITNDKFIPVGEGLSRKGYLFDGIIVSNNILRKWKIIKKLTVKKEKKVDKWISVFNFGSSKDWKILTNKYKLKRDKSNEYDNYAWGNPDVKVVSNQDYSVGKGYTIRITGKEGLVKDIKHTIKKMDKK